MVNLCTGFDKSYLDKGLALYNSLKRHSNDFQLYVCCFDDITERILKDKCGNSVITITIKELENNTSGLHECKETRTRAEYCWTCTASIIRYLMRKYQLKECTYIDADLYYYADPVILYDEIKESGADIAIMAHRFPKGDHRYKRKLRSGKYCVEYNYFNNTENAQRCLDWWAEECIRWCYSRYEPATEECPYERYGDQKYLEEFPRRFERVHEVEHPGGGVAPWNLKQYCLADNTRESANKERGADHKGGAVSRGEDYVLLQHIPSGKKIPLVFYHFQNVKYISENLVNINSETGDKKLKNSIYQPYLKYY